MKQVYFSNHKQTQKNEALMTNLGINETNAGAILKSRRLKTIVTTALASLFTVQTVFADGGVDGAMAKVDAAGGIILKVARKVGYWICIIMCIVEIFRCMASGDTKSIGKILAKFAMAFGATYLVTWLFDIIAACFG